jgi:hypothetical protein
MQGTGCCDGAACSCTERGPTAVSGSLSRAETRKAQRVQITLTSLRLTINLSGNFIVATSQSTRNGKDKINKDGGRACRASINNDFQD